MPPVIISISMPCATRGVWLFEHHKAHPREVQELMGVSSLALVDRYTRSFRFTDLSLIERGPDLSMRPDDGGGAPSATGTDGETGICLPVSLRLKGEVQRIPADLHGLDTSGNEAITQTSSQLQTPRLQQNSKRRGGDSNSRYPFGQTGFRNRRIQPLCHLSKIRRYRLKYQSFPRLFPVLCAMVHHRISLRQTALSFAEIRRLVTSWVTSDSARAFHPSPSQLTPAGQRWKGPAILPAPPPNYQRTGACSDPSSR
jgi:hypothetical protein